MSPQNRRLVLILGLVGVGLQSGRPAAADEPKRVALLVGINEYQRNGFGSLRWAENDVIEMAKELERVGFQSIVLMTGSSKDELSPTKRNVETQLHRLLQNVGKNDLVLVMLSGHGQQLKVKKPDGTTREDGFYCPVDAVVSEAETMISLSWLTDDKLNKFSGKNLVLVDACRDDVVVDLDRGVRSKGVQGRTVSLPEGTAILFSCSSGQKSIERDSLKHGVFTYSLLEAFRMTDGAKSRLTWDSLVDQVKNGVADLNPDQEPISAGSIGRLVISRRVVNDAPGFAESIGIKIIPLPRGEFAMGLSAEELELSMKLFPNEAVEYFADEQPSHQVEIRKPRGLSAHEITVGQFRKFVDDTNYRTEAEAGAGGFTFDFEAKQFIQDAKYNWQAPGFVQDDTHPVTNVTWNDATEFCKWLSRKDGRTYRLPTEAEWEYACRAGSTTLFSNGNDQEPLGQIANVADARFKAAFEALTMPVAIEADDGFVFTAPVGSYPANAWGFFDMHGNVTEWCQDWDDPGYYAKSPPLDPTGPATGTQRMIRGGTWYLPPGWSRSGNRDRKPPDAVSSTIGFRVARLLAEP